MSADKRTPHTDALDTLGSIIGENERRDAIHLAVEPVIAGEVLRPGDRVGIVNGKAFKVGKGVQELGIVDPFLPHKVKVGERFWFVVLPRMITSLRHVWTHPAFEDSVDITKEDQDREEVRRAKQYVSELADEHGISYSRLMEGAEDWVRSQERGQWGEYIVGGAEMEGSYVPDVFWDHYETITGEVVKEDHRGSFFSCSC